ncbi:MAG: CpaF/VirB11 family protein [Coprobacillus sp.]|nr:CpaF/VirB11 family protein [Coprobacillus sp.]
MVNKAVEYMEHSFLSSLLLSPSVTDISYNGKDLYYMDNFKGRQKADFKVTREQVDSFIRQLSNYTQEQFSFTNPILDISLSRYRISAIHHTISKYLNEDVTTFSIRIGRKELQITDNCSFFTPLARELLVHALNLRIPIIIGGETSSGKTELQKYLISKLPAAERVIVIDQVLELDYCHEYSACDITLWRVDFKRSCTSMENLLSTALRNNPDWIIIAETRGVEMINIIQSQMTGHSIITTVHASDVYSMPEKISMMVMNGDKKLDYSNVLSDVYYNFPLYVYVKKKERGGKISRYISEIMEVSKTGEKNILYQNNGDGPIYHKLMKNSPLLEDILDCSDSFYEAFMGENDEK